MPLAWAKALEEVRAKNPEHIFYNGAAAYKNGAEALEIIDDNIEAIRSLFDQVIDYINKSVHITEMIHMVKLPDHLKNKPHLQFAYSRPEFFVFNTYRWYHGYFDGNPANLLPRPQKEVMDALMSTIGDPQKVLDKAAELLKADQAQLGLEVLDVLLLSQPDNIPAKEMRLKLLLKIRQGDNNLMSRNTYTTFIDRDTELLVSKGVLKETELPHKKPYIYEHKEPPAFTLSIPGEFVKDEPPLGLFSARADGSMISIYLIKLTGDAELAKAAEGYAATLEYLGTDIELIEATIIELPDGTPASEFVINWATKQGVPLTTQGLTVYRDGYAISLGFHTWAGKLPDKNILQAITFK
jgi:hypothetical protein